MATNSVIYIVMHEMILLLYLGLTEQRIKQKVTIDKEIIYKRISGQEIVSYGVFVVDNEKRGSNFFLLEEIDEDFYVNPRNTMFQVKYNPFLRKPIDYYSFIMNLTNSVIKSLTKSLNTTKTEIAYLLQIQKEIVEIKKYT